MQPTVFPPHTGVLLAQATHVGPHAEVVVQSWQVPAGKHSAPVPQEVDVHLQSVPSVQAGVVAEHWHVWQSAPSHHVPTAQEVDVHAQAPVALSHVGSVVGQLHATQAPELHHVLAPHDVALHEQEPSVRLQTGVAPVHEQVLQTPASHHLPAPQSSVLGRHCLQALDTHQGVAVPVH